jgi:hypothetical protein
MRHAVVCLLQLVEGLVDATADGEGREVECFLEDGEELNQLSPVTVLNVVADQRGRIWQSQNSSHVDHCL